MNPRSYAVILNIGDIEQRQRGAANGRQNIVLHIHALDIAQGTGRTHGKHIGGIVDVDT